jgi:predicted lipoprotein with Yx(FWY)xxD motif
MRTHATPTALAGLAGAGLLLLAACGGGGGSYGGSGSSSSSGGQSPASSGTVSVGTTSFGKVLVDPNGMTLYGFANDSKGHSACTGSCATYWPPVPGSDAPQSSTASVTASFGTIKRSDGSSQLTVDGLPVYTYAGDSSAGQANGQGKNLSGGLWWVVSPDGSWVKSTSTSSSGGSSSGSSSSSGGRY